MTQWTERNYDTTPPEIKEGELKWFWFEGVARYEDWEKHGNLVVVTRQRADRVVGLVCVMMMLDMKHPKKDARGGYIYDRATMFAEPETGGYDLHRCEGVWCGPVDVPRFKEDILLTLADVEDYDEWKRFNDAYEAERAQREEPKTP